MSAHPETEAGRQLYALLPEVYRTRDNGDLSALLDGFGHLLGLVRSTMEQRLADSFPDEPLEGAACQPWLLPYFAELVGARVVSPEPAGQRAEVANAIAWRQVKGTLASVESVAQEVGRIEVEVQEGWKRVATTPRTGWPLPTAYQGQPGKDPLAVDRPAGTVDFGVHARALRTSADDPAGRTTTFAGNPVRWRQANPHGIPCFPHSYEDPSARTVDLRSPDWRKGHSHPRRLLLHLPPPSGFFAPGAPAVKWADLQAALQAAEPEPESDGTVVKRVEILDYRLEQRTSGERVDLRSLKGTVPVQGPVKLAAGVHGFEGIAFLGKITMDEGRLVLRDAAVREIEANLEDLEEPVVDASGCLIGQIAVEQGLVRLEHATVLAMATAGKLQASDSIFLDDIALGTLPPEMPPSCIRYSRIPPAAVKLGSAGTTTATPLFVELDFDDGQGWIRRPARFGEPGCGVLHPACPRSVRFGAEDGGEMGAFHDRRYALALEAVRAKLEDFLPMGLEAVLIPDPRLLVAPPAYKPT